jgi:uncharacterized damage-inducible protein DinB
MCYNETIMLPAPGHAYLLAALDNTPETLSTLLSPLPTGDAAWDARPHPDRFTLREIVAHLADWEEVWRERFERTVSEDRPLLLRPDLDRRAQERGYAHADPKECLPRLRDERAALTGRLRELPDDAWGRVAHLDRMGDISLEELAAFVLGHDSYHLRQTAEWRAALRA